VEETLTDRDRIEILLKEYDALNALLLFRLNAMDRRLPTSVGVMAATFATMLALPTEFRIAVLVAVPYSVLWLARTTLQHAKAKEDHLRRIDEIERTVNGLAESEIMSFQSRHASREKTPSGRTGRSVLVGTVLSGLMTLFLCLCLFPSEIFPVSPWVYYVYLLVLAVDLVLSPLVLSGYRYRKTAPNLISDP